MTKSSHEQNKHGFLSILRIVIQGFLSILVLAACGVAAYTLIETGPKIEPAPREQEARLVEVVSIPLSNQPTVIQAQGTVKPSREVDLAPEVSGEIIKMNPELVPGGRFQEGDVLLQIDPTDYKIAIRQCESTVAQAQSDAAIEKGQQAIAQKEYEMLGQSISKEDRELVLRKPQLEQVQAKLKNAQAVLDQAKINLERTTLTAPFNAIVRTRNVNLGAQVSPNTIVATLTGSDEYWIEATVAVDQLKWIHFPRTRDEIGSTARIFSEAAWGPDRYREGRVIRLLNALETEGRMARILIAIEDPLSLRPENRSQPPLLIDDYVRVEIDGAELESVTALDRNLIRDGQYVWIMNEKDELEVRPVQIAFRGRSQVLIQDGLHERDRIVITDLSTPIEGMLLRTQEAEG